MGWLEVRLSTGTLANTNEQVKAGLPDTLRKSCDPTCSSSKVAGAKLSTQNGEIEKRLY